MKLGIVGLPNVGKSALFNAITKAGAQAVNYPFSTIQPNTGIVPIPDPRLDVLAEMFHPKKVTPAAVEFVDISGLVKGSSKGEGLGNKFLSYIREVDAIVHVVRCFEDDNIIHVNGSVDPLRDIEDINLELIFADMETVTRRVEKARKLTKSGEKAHQMEILAGEKLLAHFDKEAPARTLAMTEDEKEIVREWFLLTNKPVIYAANISDGDVGRDIDTLPFARTISQIAQAEGARVFTISARIEEEISAMPQAEKTEFLRELGIGESSLDKLVRACYTVLGLISFLTVGSDECRAWTVQNGTKAPQAAGKIHSDLERGFIRAEVVPYDKLIALGGMNACKESGLVRSEGKEYVVKDGDVVNIRFNV